MLLESSILAFLILAIIIGVCISFLMQWVLKIKGASLLQLRNPLIGYAICLAISIIVFVLTFFAPILFILVYASIFIPFMFFSALLTKKIIKHTNLRNPLTNCIYKLGAVFFVWFMAFFPFSLIGLEAIISIPANNATRLEHMRLQDEARESILSSEIYADLTPFGLGIYKLQNEGDRFLWDITQPRPGGRYGGVAMVFAHSYNRRFQETWDDTNRGSDVLYYVKLYEGTYIIITPTTQHIHDRQLFYIYLTKELDSDSDLFRVVVHSQETIETLIGLSDNVFTRQELAHKLGMSTWEDTPRP